MRRVRTGTAILCGIAIGLSFAFIAMCLVVVVLHDFEQTSRPAVIAQAMVVVCSILVGVACGRRVYGKKSADKSVCSGCGYNLTGNVSGVCPECGQKT